MSPGMKQKRDNDDNKRDGRTRLLIVIMLTTSRSNVSIDTLSPNRPSNAYVDIGSFTNHSSTNLPSYSSPVPETTATNAMNDSAPRSWGMRCRAVGVQCMHARLMADRMPPSHNAHQRAYRHLLELHPRQHARAVLGSDEADGGRHISIETRPIG